MTSDLLPMVKMSIRLGQQVILRKCEHPMVGGITKLIQPLIFVIF